MDDSLWVVLEGTTIDHLNHYVRLIKKAQDENCPINRKGYHLHHILPKALGGTDDPDNLVWLTHKQHMAAHTLLAHIWPNQWSAVELIGLRTLKTLPKWKRRQIAYWRAGMQRARAYVFGYR